MLASRRLLAAANAASTAAVATRYVALSRGGVPLRDRARGTVQILDAPPPPRPSVAASSSPSSSPPSPPPPPPLFLLETPEHRYLGVVVDDETGDVSDATYAASSRRQLLACILDGGLTAALAAKARAAVNFRNSHRFCGVCASPLVFSSTSSSAKCSNTQCRSSSVFPRIDPVAIMLVVDSAGDRCLLAEHTRHRRSISSSSTTNTINTTSNSTTTSTSSSKSPSTSRTPAGTGSEASSRTSIVTVLAGHIEAETLEDAVRREVLEETGIRVRDVTYVTSQIWPFHSQLMLACTARAVDAASDRICIDGDELIGAAWYDRAAVVEALANRAWWDGGATGGASAATAPAAASHPRFLIPPPGTISHELISRWARGSLSA